MTYKKIRDQLLDYASQDAGQDFDDILKISINMVYRDVLSEVGEELQDRVFTLSTTSSASKYGMPLYVKEIMNIEDPDNDRSLIEIFQDDYDKTYPGTSDSDTPRFYYQMGMYGVQTQPASASTITVESSSTSDSTNRFVRVTGYTSSSLVTEQLTLTGTTAVTSTNTYIANGIERVVKSTNDGYSIAGNVTVKAGSTTLSVIPVSVTSPSYLWVQFHPANSSSITYNVRTKAYKPDLINDDDWPEIDEDYHDLLIMGAGADTLGLVGKQSMADRMMSRYNTRLKQFRGSRQRKPNLGREFQDVGYTNSLPRRPLIRNIDFV